MKKKNFSSVCILLNYKKHFSKVLFFFFILNSASLFAQQEDLLQLVEKDTPKKEFIKNAFKSTRVINGHSMEFLSAGTMDFRILHRFGFVNEGFKEFFGLDQASMRMGFDFGLTNNLMLGVGRSTFKKELDGFIKYAPVRQSKGPESFPLTIALVSGITMNTMEWEDPQRKNFFSSRLAYYFQTIIGRKFNEKLSFQLSPTMVHTNLVPLANNSNDVYALGLGGRFKLSKRMALTLDYSYVINPLFPETHQDPLAVGIDIETGGHVFQLHFSNSTGMNERALINETTGNFTKGDIRFGFNLSRVFQLRKK